METMIQSCGAALRVDLSLYLAWAIHSDVPQTKKKKKKKKKLATIVVSPGTDYVSTVYTTKQSRCKRTMRHGQERLGRAARLKCPERSPKTGETELPKKDGKHENPVHNTRWVLPSDGGREKKKKETKGGGEKTIKFLVLRWCKHLVEPRLKCAAPERIKASSKARGEKKSWRRHERVTKRSTRCPEPVGRSRTGN